MRKLQLLLTAIYSEIIVYNTTFDLVNKFISLDAYFGRELPKEGVFGKLTLASPRDACKDIPKAPHPYNTKNHSIFPIALIERSGCDFLTKVEHATYAGYAAAIIFTIDSEPPTQMGPDGYNQYIPSVMTSFEAGVFLEDNIEYLFVDIKSQTDPFPFPEHLLWPFASAVGGCLLIMLVSTIFKLVREYRKARKGRLSRKKLNQLPVIKFNPQEHGSRFESCAICLDDFKTNEKIRELPCKHGYHKTCIDPWLTANRKVCPLCKQVVLPSSEDESTDNEDTPLIRPQPELHEEDEERSIGWAQGLAGNQNQRRRPPSVSSYTSVDGELNPVFQLDNTISMAVDQVQPQIVEDGGEEISINQSRLISEIDSEDADDESTPRAPASV